MNEASVPCPNKCDSEGRIYGGTCAMCGGHGWIPRPRPRLENWSRMKNRSRVIPSPGPPEVGGIVGGDVYGSQHHRDGTTITTGDVLEVRPGQIVTRHHETTVVYDLGKSMWEDEAVRKAYEDPVVRKLLG